MRGVRRIALFGATGSIGASALDVIARHHDRYRANVLAAGKEDFEKLRRRRLFARIGSGDYDMVIVGHSSFGFIDIDPATEQRYLDEELRPEVLIVPLAGFDRAGNRLGYGGGFYDRTLAQLRASGPTLAIGFAYGVQEIRAIPVEVTDAPLDLIVTDHDVILPQAKKS